MIRAVLVLTAFLLAAAPAAAMVGDAPPAGDGGLPRHVVLIVGPRGYCTGTLITRDLVLTAAHCVPGADYKLVAYDAAHRPQLKEIATIARHPQFSLKTLDAHHATADVALIKLAAPAAGKTPAALGEPPRRVAVGDAFTVLGFGVTRLGDPRSGGILRRAALVATGRPGNLQLRLVDPATRDARPGLGACTGDSGAPVFAEIAGRPAVIGVVSWTTGPGDSLGCGGLTGVTPLSLYRGWIAATARKLGSPLDERP